MQRAVALRKVTHVHVERVRGAQLRAATFRTAQTPQTTNQPTTNTNNRTTSRDRAGTRASCPGALPARPLGVLQSQKRGQAQGKGEPTQSSAQVFVPQPVFSNLCSALVFCGFDQLVDSGTERRRIRPAPCWREEAWSGARCQCRAAQRRRCLGWRRPQITSHGARSCCSEASSQCGLESSGQTVLVDSLELYVVSHENPGGAGGARRTLLTLPPPGRALIVVPEIFGFAGRLKGGPPIRRGSACLTLRQSSRTGSRRCQAVVVERWCAKIDGAASRTATLLCSPT